MARSAGIDKKKIQAHTISDHNCSLASSVLMDTVDTGLLPILVDA